MTSAVLEHEVSRGSTSDNAARANNEAGREFPDVVGVSRKGGSDVLVEEVEIPALSQSAADAVADHGD